MKTYIVCLECGWKGIKKQIRPPEHLQDFYHCPGCDLGFTKLMFYKRMGGAWYSSCNDYEYQEIEDEERIKKIVRLLFS